MCVTIAMVGMIYHLILARLWHPEGLGWWADQGLHRVVPVLTVLWWLAYAPKSVAWRDLPFWLIWPAYALYALSRGSQTGFWPYRFLDVGVLGWPAVMANLVGLVAAFATLGAGIIFAARWSAG